MSDVFGLEMKILLVCMDFISYEHQFVCWMVVNLMHPPALKIGNKNKNVIKLNLVQVIRNQR